MISFNFLLFFRKPTPKGVIVGLPLSPHEENWRAFFNPSVNGSWPYPENFCYGFSPNQMRWVALFFSLSLHALTSFNSC